MRLSSLITFITLAVLSSAIPTTERVGISIPLTKRTTLSNEDGTVNITALRNQIIRASNKINRGFAAFEKNTGTVHPNVTKRATGAVPLTNDQGELWQGAISVGTPAQTFTVDFDTGSSDLFLPASNCVSNCAGHTLWNTSASSTARNTGRNFNFETNDGVASGTIFQDTVTVAGLPATSQAVGAATHYPNSFAIKQFPPDGLMGMAFPEISILGTSPVFQTLVAQGRTTSPEFAFKLSTSGSELFLGGVNNNLFIGTFTQSLVTQVGFWEITLDSIAINGLVPVTEAPAVVDTGTTLLLGPSAAVSRVYSAIPGAQNASKTVGPGFFTLPCTSVPVVSLAFGGRPFPISPDKFNLGPVSPGSTQCVGGLASVDLDMFVLGDVFLQNVYTSFDIGNHQVGFATLR